MTGRSLKLPLRDGCLRKGETTSPKDAERTLTCSWSPFGYTELSPGRRSGVRRPPECVAPRAQGDQPGARGVCARERLGLAPVSGADTDLRHVSESLPTTPT